MKKRALLIGSQTEGLLGTSNDVAAVYKLLEPRGFIIHCCEDDDATRRGILDAYTRLIDKTEPDDCILVYYSGHGARARNPEFDENHPTQSPPYHQFIVPTDIYDSSDTDFRGISNHELSNLLNKLTARTRNVTVMLDCCHSAMMSRGPAQFFPKALRRDWYGGISSHIEQLRAQGIDVSGRPPGNPFAVGIVACGPNESAYEYGTSTGRRIGILTESLCIALQESEKHANVDWRLIGVRIRERSQSVFPAQRPSIEGPTARILFETRELDNTTVLSVAKREKEWVLEGGRLLGITAHDRFVVMPIGSAQIDNKTILATVTVKTAESIFSRLQVDFTPGHHELPIGAPAFPIAKASKRFPVRVHAQGTQGARLRNAILAHTQLELLESSDVVVATSAQVSNDVITLHDNTNMMLFEEKRNDPDGITDTIANLCILGKAQAMRELKGGEGSSRLDVAVEVVWGRVEGGTEKHLPFQGDVLHVGESVFIRVTNRDDKHVWVSIFDIGLAGKRTLVNGNLAPDGVELAPHDDYTVGIKNGVLQGLPLTWPSGLPKNQPRPEYVIIFVMDRPQDLRPLQDTGMRTMHQSEERLQRSELQRLLDQIDTAQTRDIGHDDPLPDLRYEVKHINFFVDPTPAPAISIPSFLTNEIPNRSVLSQLSKVPETSLVKRVSVSLTELFVHGSSVLKGIPTRVDTMVITRAATMKQPHLWQRTLRLPEVTFKNTSVVANGPIYIGDVAELLTLGVWISRDTQYSHDLASLFETESRSNRGQAIIMALKSLSDPDSQPEPDLAHFSAASALLSMGHHLLSDTLSECFPLYTTTFTASENFGVGSHPPKGSFSSCGFSISYLIQDDSRGAAQ